MKRILLSFTLSVISICLFAQTSTKPSRGAKKEKTYVYPSSVIKINTTSLLFKTLAVQYERKIAQRLTLGLGLLYRPGSGLLYYDAIAEATESGLTNNAKYAFKSMTLSRLAFTPEFKFFFKRTAPKGLYLAPFARYSRDVQQFDYQYYETNTSASAVKIASAKLTDRRVGVGVLFGYQLLTKNKLAVDFWFVGPWFGNGKTSISSKVNMSNLNQIDKNAISSDLEEISAVAITNNSSGFIGSSTGYAFGFRMIGVNIGYNF